MTIIWLKFFDQKPQFKATIFRGSHQTFKNCDQANIVHDSRIDWLELNEPASKLLFRDKRLRLYVYDLETEEKVSLLSYCSYAQWVPGSDVVVGQNRNQLSVWYNINDVDRVNHIAVKGDVSGIERKDHRTEIMVQEGTAVTPYKQELILFEKMTFFVNENIKFYQKFRFHPKF